MFLERQVIDLHGTAAITHEPATPSHLLQSSSVSEDVGAEKHEGS